MEIQKDTRRLILNDLIMLDDLAGQLGASEFVRKVFPDSETMPSEDHRFSDFIQEVWKHMEMNDDWTWEYLLLQRLKLLDVGKDISSFIFLSNSFLRGLEEQNGMKKISSAKLSITESMSKQLTHTLRAMDMN